MAIVVDKAISDGPKTIGYITFPDGAVEGHIQTFWDSTIGAPTLDAIDERKVTVGFNATGAAGMPQLTTANLNSAAHAINTTNKYAGKAVWNTTVPTAVFARGPNPTDPWYNAAGSVVNSPS